MTSTSPQMLPFRSKVATLRPPALDHAENVPAHEPELSARADEGEVIDLLDSNPPPPPTPDATPAIPPDSLAAASVASGPRFCDAPTVMALPNSEHGIRPKDEEHSVRLSTITESSLVVRTPEPTRAVRRRRKRFAMIGGCLVIAALVGWFQSKRHHPAASTAASNASAVPVGSPAPAVTAAPAPVADKAAPIDRAPAPSTSAGKGRKSKPTAPRPSPRLKSLHK